MVNDQEVDRQNMVLIAEYVSAVEHYAQCGHWHAFMGVEIDSAPEEPQFSKYSWEMTPQEQEVFGEEEIRERRRK